MSGKVLLIDPIATNRMSLGSILRAAHYQIHAVSGLSEVSSLLDDALFDAVIISLNSPLDLVKLKAMPALSNVPVIASQHAADDVARLALFARRGQRYFNRTCGAQSYFDRAAQFAKSPQCVGRIAAARRYKPRFGLS